MATGVRRPALVWKLRLAPGVAALYCGFSILVLIPVLIARYPPLVDYPNHLARCYILRNLGHDAMLARYYRNVMAAQPNLALDLIIPQLSRVVSIWTAGRLFIGATLLAMAGGCILLHRAVHGRFSAWPAWGFLFVYNRLLLWGFIGYLFGLGVALVAAACWYLLRSRQWSVRLGFGVVAATVIYLMHLYALGIYAVLIGGFELADWTGVRRPWNERAGRALVIAGGLVPAIGLFLFVSPTSAAARQFVWGSVVRKLTEPFKLVVAYHPRADVAALILVVVAVLILLARGHIRVFPALVPGLVILAVLSIAMPNELFSSFGADRRIPIAFVLVAIAATDWQHASGWLRGGVMLGATVLLVLQIGVIAVAWSRSQAVYRGFIAALNELPAGARLVASVPATAPGFPPLYHVDAYAVILRDAFLPSLFAAPEDAGSSVAFTPRFEALRRRTPGVVIWPDTLRRLQNPTYARSHGPFRAGLTADYDAALVVAPRSIPAPARPPAGCRVIARGPDFVLLGLPCARS